MTESMTEAEGPPLKCSICGETIKPGTEWITESGEYMCERCATEENEEE